MTQRARILVGALAMLLVAAIGCGGNKEAEKVAEVPSASEGDHGAGQTAVTPASDRDSIWLQIQSEQAKLNAAITSGQLSDVHHLAFGIRDLVIADAKLAGAAGHGGAKLDMAVSGVRECADQLDKFGDSGDLSGVQREYSRLESLLGDARKASGR